MKWLKKVSISRTYNGLNTDSTVPLKACGTRGKLLSVCTTGSEPCRDVSMTDDLIPSSYYMFCW